MELIKLSNLNVNTSEIESIFLKGVKFKNVQQNNGYYGRIGNNVNSLVRFAITKLVMKLIEMLQNHSEQEFHVKMSGFYIIKGQRYFGVDYVGLLYKLHQKTFTGFIITVRKNRHLLDIDVNDMVNRLCYVMKTYYGWNIYPKERQCFIDTFNRIIAIVDNRPQGFMGSFKVNKSLIQ